MTARAYMAVRLTGLREQGIYDDYWNLYEQVAERLLSIHGLSLHAPHRVSNPGALESDSLSPKDIYLLDRLQVSHSDIVVACVELASFGVGAELEMAAQFGIPLIAFYYSQAAREPSRLVLGMPTGGSNLQRADSWVVRYEPTTDGRLELLAKLEALVNEVLAAPREFAHARTFGLARTLERRRRALGLSCAELARRAGAASGTVELLSLAGEPFAKWLNSAAVQRALSIPLEVVDEDRVLLPSVLVTLRIASALELSLPEMVSSGF